MSDDSDEFAEAVRRMLAAEAPVSAVRARIDGHEQGVSRAREAMVDMGLTSLLIPDSSDDEVPRWEVVVRVFDELGRVLEPGTYLSTATNLNPHNGQALTLLGRTGLERKDYPAARSALEWEAHFGEEVQVLGRNDLILDRETAAGEEPRSTLRLGRSSRRKPHRLPRTKSTHDGRNMWSGRHDQAFPHHCL